MNLYFDASRCLDQLDAKKGSVASVASSIFNARDRSRGSALLIETLKYRPVLTNIIENSGLLRLEKKTLKSLNMALLLVHDLLLAKGIQAGDGPIKQSVLRHKTRLQAELVRLKIQRGASSNLDLSVTADDHSDTIPRYARVNTCRWTSREAKKYFVSKGFSEVDDKMNLSEMQFCVDPHIPDLLVFPRQSKLHLEDAYLTGKLILQDKASSMPAVVLSPPADGSATVIDATAAPGNKTTHLSALMGNKGKLFAFERDKARFGTLQKMLTKAGSTNTVAQQADFLSVDPQDPKYTFVTHIMLDPSCSGSGIVNRLDRLLQRENEETTVDHDRLTKLAAFQLTMIKHAMQFPSVQRIVYSTCSIHAEENERVVSAALESEEAGSANFVLADRHDVLPTWMRRGLSEELGSLSDNVIRCDPKEDHTNGFFVALFVRKSTISEIHTTIGETKKSPSQCKRPANNSDTRPKKKRKKHAKEKSTVA